MAGNRYQFDVLIIDPDAASRMQLRQACAAASIFGRVHQVSSLLEAITVLTTSEHVIDIVFLTETLGGSIMSTFVRDAHRCPCGQDAAYVMVMHNSHNKAALANTFIQGSDGILLAPYSLEKLVDLTELASRIKKQRSEAREKAALTLLVQQLVQLVDAVSVLRAQGHCASLSMKMLAEACSVLPTLEGTMAMAYADILADVFGAARPAVYTAPKRLYNGASARLRKKAEEDFHRQVDGKQRTGS
jgi:hypothetical protein